MKSKIQELIKKYNLFKYTTTVLLIIAIVALVVVCWPRKDLKKQSSKSVITRNSEVLKLEDAQENTLPIETKTAKTFSLNSNLDINALVNQYYNTLITNDNSLIIKYTDSIDNMDEFKRSVNINYIESYNHVECYVMNGMLDATYIVVAISDIKYKNIETLAPNIDYFYVCTDKSGNLYITNKSISEEVQAYNDLMFKNAVIVKIAQEVAEAYDDALRKDSNLAAFTKNLFR